MLYRNSVLVPGVPHFYSRTTARTRTNEIIWRVPGCTKWRAV